MADSAELAFVKSHLNTIGALPVQYPNDYHQPPQNSLKRVPILPVEIPPPPVRQRPSEAVASDVVTLTFKSAKPPRTFTLAEVATTDTIAAIKSQLATQPGAPPADSQRLLLRGKALADAKLLKEYEVKPGDVVNVMLKSGVSWDWNTTVPTAPAPAPVPIPKDAYPDVGITLEPVAPTPRKSPGHVRIPSIVLSPSPSPSTIDAPMLERPASIPLTLDTPEIPAPSDLAPSGAYHTKISSPGFWERLHDFVRGEFDTTDDANHAFEAFLIGTKGALTASEIAKIRDSVGVFGMAGT